MNRHVGIQKLLAVYNGLDAVDRSVVDAHVQVCPACFRQLAAYAEMDARLARLTDPIPPATPMNPFDAIQRGARSRSREHAGQLNQRGFPRRVLLPAGLLLLLFLSVWLMMRVSTPVHHDVAQTPSVTPTQTPVAFVSPQAPSPIVSVELLNQFANRYPAASAGRYEVTDPGERGAMPFAAAVLRSSSLPVLSTVVAYR